MSISVNLYNPHSNQQSIHNSINNESYKYYVLNIGRQFGKSLLALNQNLYWLLKYKGITAAWVSPIFRQANKVYDEVVKAFAGTNLITKKDGTNLSITFINGSTFQFFSAERYDNIRGFTFDYLTCDEFAFFNEEAWTEVLRATVLVKGRKVLLISTPKGKNHFYRMYQLDGVNPQYKSFHMTSYDNPIINPTEIDDARLTLPDHVFRQEYLGEFIDGGSGLFTNATFKTNTGGSKFYAGIDLGRADDYTVISVINDKGEQVYINRWRHNTWSNIVSELVKTINQFKAQTFVEVNSIGDAIFEQLQSKVKTVHPFVTTSKSKQDVIEELVVATQEQSITFFDSDYLRKELEVFSYEYNPKSKNVRYAAPNGFHDDSVMATAISYHAFKNLRTKGQYSVL